MYMNREVRGKPTEIVKGQHKKGRRSNVTEQGWSLYERGHVTGGTGALDGEAPCLMSHLRNIIVPFHLKLALGCCHVACQI